MFNCVGVIHVQVCECCAYARGFTHFWNDLTFKRADDFSHALARKGEQQAVDPWARRSRALETRRVRRLAQVPLDCKMQL